MSGKKWDGCWILLFLNANAHSRWLICLRWALGGSSLIRPWSPTICSAVIGRNWWLPFGLFRTNFTIFFPYWVRSDVSLYKAPLAAAISPFWSHPHTHPPTRPLHVPYSFRQVRGFFNVPCLTLKMQETGPTVFRPYPRRLGCLTICRCNYKGSTFSSVILRPWVLVRSGARTLDLPHSRLAPYQLS